MHGDGGAILRGLQVGDGISGLSSARQVRPTSNGWKITRKHRVANDLALTGSPPSPYRHMPRMRAPTSTRTCRASGREVCPAATTGQVQHSNSCSRLAGMKRVREA